MCDDDGGGGVYIPKPGALPGRVLILGAGWVGSRLATRLADAGASVAVTNRPASAEKKKPLYFRPVSMPAKVKPRVTFEINDEETWANLPEAEEFDAVIVTFPLTSDKCQRFWEQYLSKVKTVVCYSSTSVYLVDEPGQQVDEDTTLKPTLRAQMEKHFLDNDATILTISGIFGEPRGPRGVCACLTGYVSAGGTLNAGSNINMVHVEDILAATCACLEAPDKSKGDRLNVAGGHFQLAELLTHCKHPVAPTNGIDLTSKIVSSQRLLDRVMPEGYQFVQPL